MALEGASARAASGEACRLCGGTRRRPVFAKGGWTFLRCAECGLVSISPLPAARDMRAHHDASYDDGRYAAFAAAEAVRAAIARDRLVAVRALAPKGAWLDVGCSTGAFLAEAAAAGLEAEGLELSAAAAARARARGLAVTQAAVESFTPGRCYAAVTGFDVVEHLPDPAAFVRRAAGWLLPGGILALTLPDAASPTARLLGRHWFYYAPPDHIHYFTPPTIRRLLAQSGFHDVSVRPSWKPLTVDYAAAQLAAFTPRLAPAARAVAALVPRRWRTRPWPLPLGEMLVVARLMES